jgi:anti-sigma factor RsiW
MSGDITCRELVELVTDYLDGALTSADRSRFEQHLLICDGCSAHVGQLRQTRRALGALGEEQIDGAVRADLLNAFREWRNR